MNTYYAVYACGMEEGSDDIFVHRLQAATAQEAEIVARSHVGQGHAILIFAAPPLETDYPICDGFPPPIKFEYEAQISAFKRIRQ